MPVANNEQKVLVIDRQRWLRGSPTDSFLLRESDEKMCCLGFDALAWGLKQDYIKGVGEPIEVEALDDGRKYIHRARRKSDAIEAAIRINDDPNLGDTDREAHLVPVLKQLGWDDVQFIN